MATGNPKSTWTTQAAIDASEEIESAGVTLNYSGKKSIQEILETTPCSIMPIWANRSDSPNRLYYGDNLTLLASLMHDETVKGKVKLIYIDPPFATNSVFHSRDQTDAYQDILVSSSFIEFIRRRIILLREMLSEDGSIYIHLDENMAFYVKIIMDEVFGIRNFRNWITRRKCSHKNYTKKMYGNISDYILFYTKSDQYIWNRPVEAWTSERAIKEYTYVEDGTGRRYKKVPIHAPGTRNGETGKPWRGIPPPPGKHWQYLPKTLEEMDMRGEIYWSSSGNPRRKIYLDESEGVAVQDIWFNFRDTRNQNVQTTGYPTEKNPQLLERIIQASSNPGDLVLDSFCGSGTTLAVADMLGRRWIGMDNSSEAISATLRRFVFGTERIGDFVQHNPEFSITNNTAEFQLGLFAEEMSLHKSTEDRQIVDFALYRESSTDIANVDKWQHLLSKQINPASMSDG